MLLDGGVATDGAAVIGVVPSLSLVISLRMRFCSPVQLDAWANRTTTVERKAEVKADSNPESHC
jgi:hypothetical protein